MTPCMQQRHTGEFHRLGRCFVDWAIAAVGEGDTCQLYVSFTRHNSGPICETPAQSMEFSGNEKIFFSIMAIDGESEKSGLRTNKLSKWGKPSKRHTQFEEK